MEKGRLEAFSDGVIAIIITIMVLELKVPHGETLQALGGLWPKFLSYVLSFIYVGIYWNNHHHLLKAMERTSATGNTMVGPAIAQALITKPDMLLLDEPLAGLDLSGQVDIVELVHHINHDRGVTVLFVTHDIDEAIALGDRIVVFSSKPTRIIDFIETRTKLTLPGATVFP